MKTKYYWLIIFIITTLVLVPILVFYIYFNDHQVSDKTSDWGDFGDYFSGFTTPLLTIINSIILVWITFKISKIDSERQKDALQFQREIDTKSAELQERIASISNQTQIKTTKATIQTTNYNDFLDKLDQVNLKIFEDPFPEAKLMVINEYFKEFCIIMPASFPSLKNLQLTDEISILLNSMFERIKQRKSGDMSVSIESLLAQLKDFQLKKIQLCKILQNDIISGLKI